MPRLARRLIAAMLSESDGLADAEIASQSSHVQHASRYIHVPCSNTPVSINDSDPHSGQPLCSVMPFLRRHAIPDEALAGIVRRMVRTFAPPGGRVGEVGGLRLVTRCCPRPGTRSASRPHSAVLVGQARVRSAARSQCRKHGPIPNATGRPFKSSPTQV